jgi:hypothetical protein
MIAWGKQLTHRVQQDVYDVLGKNIGSMYSSRLE